MVQIAEGKYSHHIHTQKGKGTSISVENHRVGEKDKIKVKWKDKQSGHGKDDYSIRQLISTVILRVFLAAGKRADCCCFETPKPVYIIHAHSS